MLLALDTSTAYIGLALYDGVRILGETTWQSHAHHTVELAPAVAALFQQTGVDMTDVRALGVALGPGSFTSLRVGLAFAKGLALARHLALLGVPTLDVVAAGLEVQNLPLAAVLQAGRGRLALVWYKARDGVWQSQSEPQVTTADALAESIHSPTLVCGELSAEERQRLARKRSTVRLASPAQCVRRPAILAELAWKRWRSSETIQAGAKSDAQALAPIYLHVANPIPS